MKAVYINEHGGTSVLAYGDRPEPEIEPGEVMLKVRGSALNRLDIGMREGRSYRGPLPRIMGCDVAGEVVQISPDADTKLKPTRDGVVAVEQRTLEHEDGDAHDEQRRRVP